eukprot:CAMPEP_0168526240 /NCGR_PEP_ID=MMETSP0405-20121227/11844_1 /TAXON_ID=498012 /ORGANISM="Trichosphaerium sp, Strain Am-I-7 wt" /LENGTH=93 /DNA_ID=CAMNT_0008549033 /DNA_START=198 /DNA_END=479 /DNA_ORIENTATION=+
MTVKLLRQICREKSLLVGGRKTQLVDRIIVAQSKEKNNNTTNSEQPRDEKSKMINGDSKPSQSSTPPQNCGIQSNKANRSFEEPKEKMNGVHL